MGHTLVVLRHAQAVDYAPGKTDHERPLSDKGRHQAGRVGAELAERGIVIDQVLCSSSTRTRETLAGTGVVCPVTFSDEIYNASSDSILDEIRGTDESVGTLLVIGHAPGIPAVTHELAGPGSDEASLEAISARFPTATWCVLETDQAWADLDRGRLVHTARG